MKKTHTLMTTWGRFDPPFDSLDDFTSTTPASCYLCHNYFVEYRNRIHLRCDWVLFKVPLLPFLKDASLNYHFGTECIRKLHLQWNTIALKRNSFQNKQVKEKRDFSFWSEGHKRMKLSNFCLHEGAKVLSLNCFITGGSEEWKGEEGRNVSVI